MHLIAAEFSWTSPESWLAILMVAVGLGFVILVHELGHFLVAKACGVKCEKFYIGFDFFDIKLGPITIPRALVKFHWGETEYGVGIIPLGGYVKMLGQDDNPANAAREAERIRIARQQAAGEAPHSAHNIPHGDLPPEPTEEQLEQYELDPRSYPAKSVPQRMAIISAGVVMNLIFAVIFAAIAYRAGVSFLPTIVGSVLPGSPAWMAGLEPGDRILQIGREGEPSERLRFLWDLMNSVGLAEDKQDLPLLVRRHQTGETDWITVRPSIEAEGIKIPAIGVGPPLSNKLSSQDPTLDHSPAAAASPPLAGGDVIVAINGQPVDDGQQLRALFARNPSKALTLTVERQNEGNGIERLDVRVPTNPMRRVGLVMGMGEVTAVKPNSPADRAGFEPGDQIRRINDESVGDPLILPYRLQQWAGQEVEFEVERKTEEGSVDTLTLTVVPEQINTLDSYRRDGPVGADAVGIAYYVTDRVAQVVPGSPAAEAGFRAGDKLSDVQLLHPADAKEAELEERGLPQKAIELGRNKRNWPYIHDALQRALPGTRLRINYVRGGKTRPVAELLPEKSDEWFVPERGILLVQTSEIYTAESFGEALALGLRQTKEDALTVLMVLKRLVTGDVPLTSLGGPGSIAYVATSEASEGVARLLMFLTLLSANLAVLNFLPIPVLDGGHMMFLIAEGIRGKPLDEKWLVRLTVAGFAFVISLMLFVIGLDVVRFTGLYGS